MNDTSGHLLAKMAGLVFFPVVQEEDNETSEAGMKVAAASPFAGFVETEFSSAEQQYFYADSREMSRCGSGSFGVVRECVAPSVLWLPFS